jgi:hypothetical protein
VSSWLTKRAAGDDARSRRTVAQEAGTRRADHVGPRYRRPVLANLLTARIFATPAGTAPTCTSR